MSVEMFRVAAYDSDSCKEYHKLIIISLASVNFNTYNKIFICVHYKILFIHLMPTIMYCTEYTVTSSTLLRDHPHERLPFLQG